MVCFLNPPRACGYILLKPILSLEIFGMGAKVFSWPHIFVLSWGGFKGAVTLALGMICADDTGIGGQLHPQIRKKMLFHSAGAVGFTLLFNASTMRFLLKRLGKVREKRP
ncbi:hypothetical protein BV898_12711 [Hypsibius exemplaris]|uniref:Uncharacterized protein n=1 Tax=Hypsibius exemplaris TaxID=2072580 RepID=A0A1W0WCW0_HYPEX|nr:hypothetical protein BV898_12711 [Hypsibius exemplaris]